MFEGSKLFSLSNAIVGRGLQADGLIPPEMSSRTEFHDGGIWVTPELAIRPVGA
jgi:hypothetical protein